MTAATDRIASAGSSSLRRLVWVQVVFALLAVGVSLYVLRSVNPLVEQREALEDSLGVLRGRLAIAETKLKAVEARLQQATNLGQYVHPIDFVDLKLLYSRYPRESRILEQILRLRETNTPWKLGGRSPAEGFDSPGFAAFVLGRLQASGERLATSEAIGPSALALKEQFPLVPAPAVGDLVLYPGGYALFYFEDRRSRPYVIGMTPSGITALEPTFASPPEYHRVLQ